MFEEWQPIECIWHVMFQVDQLSAEIHERKRRDKDRVDSETQTEEYVWTETGGLNSSEDYLNNTIILTSLKMHSVKISLQIITTTTMEATVRTQRLQKFTKARTQRWRWMQFMAQRQQRF